MLDTVVLATGFSHGLGELFASAGLSLEESPADGPVAGAPGQWICGFRPEFGSIRRVVEQLASRVAVAR
jgi:hypothetical protein